MFLLADYLFFFCLKCNCEARNLPNLTTLDSGVLQKVVVLVVLIFFLISQQSSPHFFFPEVFSLVSRRCLWTEMVYFGPFSPAAEALLPTSFRSLFVSVYIFHAKYLLSFYKTSSNSQYAKDCGYLLSIIHICSHLIFTSLSK